MNSAKLKAYIWAGVAIGLNLLQVVVPILPPQWSAVVTSLLGVLTFYHLYQSHTPAALGAAGYTKNR